MSENKKLTDTELDGITGGRDNKIKTRQKQNCSHEREYIREVPGHVFGTNGLYRCRLCGELTEKIGLIHVAYTPRDE